MNAEITDVAPCRKHLKVELPAERVEKTLEDSYRVLQDSVQIKGFRQGHAPRRVLERRFKPQVEREAAARLFQESFVEALEQKDLAPMGDPDLDPSTLSIQPGQPFSYETDIDVRPQFDLPEYKGIEIEKKKEAVTDADIDEHLLNLRQRFTRLDPVEEPAKEGDTLEIDAKLVAGEEELMNETERRLRVEGDQLFGVKVDDLAKKLAGKQKGEVVTLDMTLPDTIDREDLRGKAATATLTIRQVLRGELPELDDEFAGRLGMKNVDDLRGRIRENLDQEREQQAREQMEQQLVDKLIAATSFELPEEFMKRQSEQSFRRASMQMAQYGATQEFLKEREEEMRKASQEQTERSVRRAILFDAIADKEEIEVTESELTGQIMRLAEAYQTTPAKMIERIRTQRGLTAMASELRDIKVTQLLLDSAKVKGDTAAEG